MRRKEYFILPILIALLFLQFLPYQLVSVLGQEITLNAELYDPRDVFRGDYVALNFTQETVSSSTFKTGLNDLSDHYGKTLYAVIKNQGKVWTVQSVTLERPSDVVYISCKMDYYDSYSDEVMLDFGIDRFYIETNTGREIEDAAREDRLLARLKVWRGQMIMTDVIIQNN